MSLSSGRPSVVDKRCGIRVPWALQRPLPTDSDSATIGVITYEESARAPMEKPASLAIIAVMEHARSNDRILAAIDRSPGAATVVDAALELAIEREASIVFLHVDTRLALVVDDAAEAGNATQDAITAADRVLATAARAADERGVAYELVLVPGGRNRRDLAATVAGMAAGADVSVIVIGSRGRGTAAGGLLGSASHELLRWTTVPVFVVPTGSKEPVTA